MQQPSHNDGYLFEDSIICGAMGGAIAYLLGAHLFAVAMLCALFGPIFILWAARALRSVRLDLPGRESGTYEFAAFAVCVVVAIMGFRLFS